MRHDLMTLVTPETLLAWPRTPIAGKYYGSERGGPGRPHTQDDIPQLVVRLTSENRDRGCRSIQGALADLGEEGARSTIANLLMV